MECSHNACPAQRPGSLAPRQCRPICKLKLIAASSAGRGLAPPITPIYSPTNLCYDQTAPNKSKDYANVAKPAHGPTNELQSENGANSQEDIVGQIIIKIGRPPTLNSEVKRFESHKISGR